MSATQPAKPFNTELFARVMSAVVLAPLAVALAWFGGGVAIMGAAAIAVVILWEWNGLARGGRMDALFLGGLATLAVVAGSFLVASHAFALMVFALALIGALATFGRDDAFAWGVRGMAYALAFLVPLVVLRESASHGFAAIVFLFAVVWSTDVCAFFAGRAIGGPKLWPAISPKKTWAGFVGGTLGGAAMAALAAHVLGIPDKLETVAVAALLSVVAHGGDLFESWVKRHFHAKDSGHIIPGHGGAMDRVDGFIVAASVAMVIGVVKGGIGDAAGGLMLW
jgi:phosphatidate cytidylyltransferase